jgi:CRP-like cAMP-binding protein
VKTWFQAFAFSKCNLYRYVTGCSNQFMTEVCLRMSPISYPQFHPVYCQGELGADMYFISKGATAIILSDLPHNASQEEIVAMVGLFPIA